MGEESIEAYMENAREHLETAKVVTSAGKYFDAVFHCIVCIENATSALILHLGATPSKRHANHLVLQRLLGLVEPKFKESFEKVLEITAELLPQISRTRYPFVSGERMFTPSNFYSKTHAEEAMEKASYTYTFANNFLERKLKG